MLAILGPSIDSEDGYKFTNQWENWSVQIPNKEIPRPNAFDLIGCSDDDCPLSLNCWNAGGDGFWRTE